MSPKIKFKFPGLFTIFCIAIFVLITAVKCPGLFTIFCIAIFVLITAGVEDMEVLMGIGWPFAVILGGFVRRLRGVRPRRIREAFARFPIRG